VDLVDPLARSAGPMVRAWPASGIGEPQISQTGPSWENSPHHSHAIFVFVMPN
jgi:hypothetical protein